MHRNYVKRQWNEMNVFIFTNEVRTTKLSLPLNLSKTKGPNIRMIEKNYNDKTPFIKSYLIPIKTIQPFSVRPVLHFLIYIITISVKCM